MKAQDGFLEAAIAKAARHVTGLPPTNMQRRALGRQLSRGAIVGVHVQEDDLCVVSKERRPGGHHYTFRQFDRLGRLRKGMIAGSMSAAIGEFERRTGETFGRKEAGTLASRDDRIRDTLGYLMEAVRERHTVTREHGGNG